MSMIKNDMQLQWGPILHIYREKDVTIRHPKSMNINGYEVSMVTIAGSDSEACMHTPMIENMKLGSFMTSLPATLWAAVI
jgi:hypothetical protein